MSDLYFDTESPKFKNFYENFMKPQLQKIEYGNNYIQRKFRKRIVYSINIFLLLIFLHSIFSTVLSSQYLALEGWVDKVVMDYYKWYKAKTFYFRIFLPSKPIFWGLPSFLTFAILSFFILPIWCVSPFIKPIRYRTNIFQSFFSFFDENLEILNHQKLKYIGDLEENFSLPRYRDLSLEDNIEVKINAQSIDIAQMKLTTISSNYRKQLGFLFAKNTTVYRGLVLSMIIPYIPRRFIKIFVDDNDFVDTTALEGLNQAKLTSSLAQKRVKVFASRVEDLENLEYLEEILKYIDIIQQHNFASPTYFDQSIKNKLQLNLTESEIISYNYIEITVLENRIMILIPSNRKLLDFGSAFHKIDISNDINFLFSSMNLLMEVTKQIKGVENLK